MEVLVSIGWLTIPLSVGLASALFIIKSKLNHL